MTILITVLLALIFAVLMCIYGALVTGLERAGLRDRPSTRRRPPVPDPPPGAGGRWVPPGGNGG